MCMCILGIKSTAFNVAAQSEIILHAGAAGSVAMAFFSGIFNLGIGTGSFIGGKVVDLINLGSIGYIGAVIGLLAGIYCILSTK